MRATNGILGKPPEVSVKVTDGLSIFNSHNNLLASTLAPVTRQAAARNSTAL